MRWFEQKRLTWILERLRDVGFINRKDIMQQFGISTAQASLDLREFQKRFPGALAYNLTSKRYEAM